MRRILSVIAFLIFCSAVVEAQSVSRAQVMKTMYQVNVALESGKSEEAIDKLQQLSKLLPRMSLLYLRQAEIYADMADAGDERAVTLAVEKYREYLSVEMDARKASSVSARLRALEDRLKAPHFEEVEQAKAQQEVAEKKVLPVAIDDAAALLFVQEAIMLPDPLPTVSAAPSLSLFAQVKAAAETDSCQLYEVARYMYYGIDTPTDTIGAIRLMNRCAAMPCGKNAALWLAIFYYEKAYEDNGLSSVSKRTYMEASRYNMLLLKMQDAPEWYLLQSRILENGDLADVEKAAALRKRAAQLGVTSLPALKPVIQ